MEDLARSDYPAMLAHLQPMQAVTTLNDRVKRFSKIDLEIADWLQERRKIEELYVQNLRRLTQFKSPNTQSELGVFYNPWDKILQSVEALANCHHSFATRIERDLEQNLRNFPQRREVTNMHTIAANLTTMARELEDARDKAEKLQKKGGKASTQKMDQAASRLESAQQQWESQAPFVYENLQALDELRVNQLRDILTQYQTHESDRAQKIQATAELTLAAILGITTEQEIRSFAQRVTGGKPALEKRTSTRPPVRQSTSVAGSVALSPPSTANTTAQQSTTHPDEETTPSEHSTQHESHEKPAGLRSKLGTMLGRRRQSIHGGFGQLSPQKTPGPFARNLGSSHGRSVSPRVSINDLTGASSRLDALPESPTLQRDGDSASSPAKPGDAANGVASTNGAPVSGAPEAGAGVNGAEDFAPPPGPPPSQAAKEAAPSSTDADGYSVRPEANDPISLAQKEAAVMAGGEDGDQLLKVDIKSAPVADEDPDAKKAALSNVASTLTAMGLPSRKTGTIRGRRDVRNTIYVPAPTGPAEALPESPFPPSPATLPTASSRPPAVAALASEASVAGTSDSQSVRSGTSLGSLLQVRHPEMSGPGLNSSIIETMSACFEDGVATSAKIAGEIAFSYNAQDGVEHNEYETIRIGNFPTLEAIGPNRIFVQNSSPERADQFAVDVSHLNKMSAAFTYRVHSDDSTGASLARDAPLLIRPTWRPQGDKLGLLLQYGRNPACTLPDPVTLHNVIIFATYVDARASGAQTKPSGTHLKDKHLVYWRLGDVTLSSATEPHKIVCRIVGAENAEPKPGVVEARWEYTVAGGQGTKALSGIYLSRLEGRDKGKAKADDAGEEDDPFADDGLATPGFAPDEIWGEVPLSYKLVTGKYEAKESS